jgi:hypothetical protein
MAKFVSRGFNSQLWLQLTALTPTHTIDLEHAGYNDGCPACTAIKGANI